MHRIHLRTNLLISAAAAVELFVGLTLFAFPGEYGAPHYAALRPFFPVLALALIAGSVVLWLAPDYPLPEALRRALLLLPAAPLLAVAAGLAAQADWAGVALHGSLGLGLLLAPWLPAGGERPEGSSGMDLGVAALGLAELAAGGWMLLRPGAFATLAYAALRPVLPLAGAAGLVGGAALVVPAGPGESQWESRSSLRLAGAALPLLLVISEMHSGDWTGVLTWGTWVIAVLAGSRAPRRTPALVASPDEEEALSPSAGLEGTLELWSWLLVLVVVGLSAISGVESVAPPALVRIFVLAISAYNIVAYWALPGLGDPARRVFWHLAFSTVALGVLLAGAGPVGHLFLAMLVLIPPLATHALGPAAGFQMLVLAAVVVVLGELTPLHDDVDAPTLAMGEALVEIVVLIVAAAAAMRSGGLQRLLMQKLMTARTALERQVAKLTLVHRVGNSIRRSFEVDEILRALVSDLGAALGVDHCGVRLRRGDEHFPLVQEYTAPGVRVRGAGTDRLPRAAQAALSQGVAAVADLLAGGSGAQPGWQARLAGMGARAAMSAPILVGGEMQGFIYLHQCGAPRHWTQEEMDFLEAMANQVGVALANAAAHQALRQSEERFRSAFGYAAIGMALISADNRFLQVNRSLCEMLGRSEAELVATGPAAITVAADRERDQESRRQVLAGEVQSCQLEKRLLHKLGHPVWVQVSLSAVHDAGGAVLHLIAQIQDVTDRKRFEAQLVHLANRDPLTEVFNRRRFQEELERQLAHARRYSAPGALLFLDLDQFKYVNDSRGHQVGDQILRGVSSTLQQHLRETDTLGRLGGDEFAILLPHVGAAEAQAVGRQVLQTVRRHVTFVEGQPISVSASIGIALFPAHGRTAEELLAHADMAMYEAKQRGRDGCWLYAPDQDQQAQMESKLHWERRIREALDGDHFFLDAQPVQRLADGGITYYELLLRMRGDQGQVIMPDAFLGIAERFGLIHAIDRWVVTRAIRLIAAQTQSGRELCFGVNLSGQAFLDGELLPLIRREVASSGIDPAALILEITETTAVADLTAAREFIDTLKAMGCRFALDDFGAGFSSFYFLKHLPVDFMKIDGSFVRNMAADATDRHLVKAMVEVARGLGKQTVAEFVGDAETERLLREYGVDHAQGYYIGRPGPLPPIEDP